MEETNIIHALKKIPIFTYCKITLNKKHMVIDHIGIVTKSLDSSIKQWESTFGYSQYTEIVENTKQQVRIVFMRKKDSLEIKLIEPSSNSSPIYKFAMRGGGLHHLCFKSDNLNKSIDFLKSKNCLLVAPPQPGEAFDNNPIAFLLAQNNLNIEVIDTFERANMIVE